MQESGALCQPVSQVNQPPNHTVVPVYIPNPSPGQAYPRSGAKLPGGEIDDSAFRPVAGPNFRLPKIVSPDVNN